MNHRWPALQRRAFVLRSMTALSHTGLVGKRLGKADRGSMRCEFGPSLRAPERTTTTTMSTMPCLLERLGPLPCAGSDRRLGFGDLLSEIGLL